MKLHFSLNKLHFKITNIGNIKLVLLLKMIIKRILIKLIYSE